MFHKIDDWLIDRVFQRISDGLARFASCYAIAAFLLTGAALGHWGLYIVRQEWVGLLLSSMWLPFRVADAYRLEREPQRDVLPVERVRYFFQRIIFLMLQIAISPLVLLDATEGNYWMLASDTFWWVIVVGFYFMACRRRPPSRNHSLSWREMLWGRLSPTG